MSDFTIQRDANVLAPDGETGRVTHVIVAPETREVTDLVVAHNGRESLIPMADVLSAGANGVQVRGALSSYEAAATFERARYHPLDEAEAAPASQHRTLHGGAPLLSANGDAVEVGEPGEQPTQRLAGGAPVSPGTDDGSERLLLRQERLRIATEQQQVGVLSVGTRLVEHLETLTVPVREERILVERRPGEDRVVFGETELREGESIEIPIFKERLEVAKELVVIEEVTVRKEVVEREQRIQETLRREELDLHERGDLVMSRSDGR
jgi:uncharacterized protein (TIGR02271 family)